MTTTSRQPTLRSQAHLQGTQSQRRKTQPCKRACLHPRRPSYISLCIFYLLAWGLTSIYGQTPSNLTIFSRPTFPQLIQLPSAPQPATFQRIDINQYSQTNKQPNNFNINPQSNNINQIATTTTPNQVQKAAFMEMEQMINASNQKYLQQYEATKSYHNSYEQFLKLNPDSFSITKAIYLAENGFNNDKFTYEQFVKGIKIRADIVKQILKREGINSSNNTALNYGIQKLFSQANSYYNPKTKQTVTVPPLKYDFKDFMGEKDWKQLFVSKLLMTGKGQCHSMPLLYLAIAEQLGAKAYLSLAPEHSFIQYFNNDNDRINFETTNGNMVSQSFMLRSGFINASALKNKTYLDTLSQRQLYAQCLADLLISYEREHGHDDFAEQMKQKIQQINPNNLTAKIVDANQNKDDAISKIRAAGKPSLKDLPNYPEAYKAYLKMQESYKEIDNTGFQDMPKEAYRVWRKSVEKEKQKEETKEIQQRMQREIQMLKNLRPTLIITPKG